MEQYKGNRGQLLRNALVDQMKSFWGQILIIIAWGAAEGFNDWNLIFKTLSLTLGGSPMS